MLNLQFTQAEFNNAKNILTKHMANFIYKPLTLVAAAYLKNRVNKMHYSNSTLLATIESVGFTDVKKINELLQSKCLAQCLIQGNCTKEIVPSVAKAIEPFLKAEHNTVCPGGLERERDREENAVLPLCAGQEEVYLCKSFNPNETNSYISIFFEIGKSNNTYVVDWDFKLSKLLILSEMISEQFFHQLRSVEQSGYIVACRLKNIGTKRKPLYGLNFMIQSAKKSPNILKNRIKKFIKQFAHTIDSMSDETYIQYVNACNHTLTLPHNNIFEEVDKNIQNIIKCKKFDHRKRLSKLINTVNKTDITKFYSKYFIDKKTKRVRTVQIYGKHNFTT
jgi:secreted Zn-dependent insulinase-like peptidase